MITLTRVWVYLQSVCVAEPCKNGGTNQVQFGRTSRVGPRNNKLNGGTYGRHLANTIEHFDEDCCYTVPEATC